MISISVIMSVYNGEKYVAKAIESILDQTYRDFEFIIANDASTDDSLSIIKYYASIDDRIKLVDNEKNKGLPVTLNHLISLSKGSLIARMDHDDIAVKIRFQKQVEIFENDSTIDFVFSGTTLIDDKSEIICNSWRPSLKMILEYLPYVNFIPHPSVMLKKELFLKYGAYKTDIYPKDDMELWNRYLSAGIKFYYIRDSLLLYRINPGSSQNIGDGLIGEKYYYYLSKTALGSGAGLYILKKYRSHLKLKSKALIFLASFIPFSFLSRYYLYAMKRSGRKSFDH